ncbi:serine/threonine-protein kinase, partial [Planosporangium mesophilum]
MSVTQPLLAERYRLVRSLGQGGMGRVWLARDEVLHRDVAIKEVVPPEGLTAQERDEMRRRTLREARAAARLNHPSVVRVYDVVRTDMHPWIVMEYVPSRSLHEVINEDGTLPPARVARIGLQVLGALRAAHRAGVLHRDVKPSNVLLTDDGRVVLTDFGLATMAGDATVTRPGMVLGSPAYIAPERARQGITGPESDLWSLGATLYAAVEGSSPYQRSSAIETLTALVTEEPPPARNAGPLKSVLNGLLRKDPESRIDAEEAERLLRRAAGGGFASRMWLVPKPRRSQARPPKAEPVSPPVPLAAEPPVPPAAEPPVPPAASAPAPSAADPAPSAPPATVSASAPVPAPVSKPVEPPAAAPAPVPVSKPAAAPAKVATPEKTTPPAKAAPAAEPADRP